MFELLLIAKKKSGFFDLGTGYLLFTQGSTSSSIIRASKKISFSNLAIVDGSSLVGRRSAHTGVGNTIEGISVGGTSSGSAFLANTEKYRYSDDAVATGGALNTPRIGCAACGNNEIGLIYGGGLYYAVYVNSNQREYSSDLASLEKYTYASDSITNQTSSGQRKTNLFSTGNSQFGIFISGTYQYKISSYAGSMYSSDPAYMTYLNTGNIYTYATLASTSSTFMGYRWGGAACGNADTAIFAGGGWSSRQDLSGSYTTGGYATTTIYKYAAKTSYVGASMINGGSVNSASSNSSVGFFIDGPYNKQYNFSANIWLPQVKLTGLPSSGSTTSSSPGWSA